MEDWSEQPAFSKAIGKLVEKAPESALQNIAAIAVKDLKYYKHVHALLERQFKRWCDAGEQKALRNLLYAISEILQASHKQYKSKDKFKERLKGLVISILDALSASDYQDHARRILVLWRKRGLTSPELHEELCYALRVPLAAAGGTSGTGAEGAAAQGYGEGVGRGQEVRDSGGMQPGAGTGSGAAYGQARDSHAGMEANGSQQHLPPPPAHEVPPPSAMHMPGTLPPPPPQPQSASQHLPPPPPVPQLAPPPSMPSSHVAGQNIPAPAPGLPPPFWPAAHIPGLSHIPGLGPPPPWPGAPPGLMPPPPPGWPPGIPPPPPHQLQHQLAQWSFPPGVPPPPMQPPPGWPQMPTPPQPLAATQQVAGSAAPQLPQPQPHNMEQAALPPPPPAPGAESAGGTKPPREFGRRKSRWGPEGEGPPAGSSTDGEGSAGAPGAAAGAPPPPPQAPAAKKAALDDDDFGLLYDPFADDN